MQGAEPGPEDFYHLSEVKKKWHLVTIFHTATSQRIRCAIVSFPIFQSRRQSIFQALQVLALHMHPWTSVQTNMHTISKCCQIVKYIFTYCKVDLA